ncbi:hypothetical protein GCM10017783_25780 [Deinococcus piscis]|uniref:Uncharacterized protein n=1 Tax=Deinococcus piscis TaxID=394230 RepID=A0ABQ3KFG0_9DEIO|nr:hypothetical protein [Deinococcus piscis]GHG12576.1 hypothetical protein GCM10017783_25780 [Deinococcus piscis]
MSKASGESAHDALQRHIDEHDARLSHMENHLGMHVPRGSASIMIDLPGSGKSHYLKAHYLNHGVHMHVDVDALEHLATGEHDFKYPSHSPDSHPTKGGQPHPQAGQRIKRTYDEGNPVHVEVAHPVNKRLEAHMFSEFSKRRTPMVYLRTCT